MKGGEVGMIDCFIHLSVYVVPTSFLEVFDSICSSRSVQGPVSQRW